MIISFFSTSGTRAAASGWPGQGPDCSDGLKCREAGGRSHGQAGVPRSRRQRSLQEG